MATSSDGLTDKPNAGLASLGTQTAHSGLMLWRERDHEVAAKLVQRLASTRGPNGWNSTVAFELDSQALLSLIDLPRWQRMRWAVVIGAVTDLAHGGAVDLATFAARLHSRLAALDQEARTKDRECWFILPSKLPCDFRGGPVHIRLLGVNFRFMRIENMTEYLGSSFDGADQHTVWMLQENLPHTAVCFSQRGFPTEAAFDMVSPAFDALRGAVEVCKFYGTTFFSSHPRRKGCFPYPRYLVCIPEGGSATTLRVVAPDWELKDKVNDPHKEEVLIDRLRVLAGAISELPAAGSVETLIADLLRLYAQAMEQEFHYQGLLAFWQMAEALTLAVDEQGKGERVVSRLSWFERYLRTEGVGSLLPVLRGLMHKRNEIVHSGIHDRVEEHDVNILKLACEVGLEWLVRHRKSLQTLEHLRLWWGHHQRATVELDRLRSVLGSLEQMAD